MAHRNSHIQPLHIIDAGQFCQNTPISWRALKIKDEGMAGIPIILLSANPHPERIITITDNRVLIQRRGVLHMAETENLLKSALAVMKPDYSESTDDILTKLRMT